MGDARSDPSLLIPSHVLFLPMCSFKLSIVSGKTGPVCNVDRRLQVVGGGAVHTDDIRNSTRQDSEHTTCTAGCRADGGLRAEQMCFSGRGPLAHFSEQEWITSLAENGNRQR